MSLCKNFHRREKNAVAVFDPFLGREREEKAASVRLEVVNPN